MSEAFRRAAALTALVLSACGGGGPIGDCRDAERVCDAPFQCQSSAGAYARSSSALGAPTCQGTPAGQVVPFASQTTGDPWTLHWTSQPAGCIPITYDASAVPKLAEVNAAVTAVDAVSCAHLCLAAPVPSETAPDYTRAERRIHFTRGAPPGGPTFDVIIFPLLYWETASGRLFAATLYLEDEFFAGISEGDVTAALLLAVRLAVPPEGSDSVLSVSSPRPQTPTSLDEEALCTLYGEPTYCGD